VDRDFFLAAKLSLGNSFPVEFLPRVGLRTLTRVEDMDGILVFYWFFIILEATTYMFLKVATSYASLFLIGCLLFLLQLHTHMGFPACRIKGSHDILE